MFTILDKYEFVKTDHEYIYTRTVVHVVNKMNFSSENTQKTTDNVSFTASFSVTADTGKKTQNALYIWLCAISHIYCGENIYIFIFASFLI